LAAHKTQQARISIFNPEDGARKAYYLGAFGTPESHALYSVLQLWYNTHEGQILERSIAQFEAAAILNSNHFSPDGYEKSENNGFAAMPETTEPSSIVLPVVINSALAIAAMAALFTAGVYVGRPSNSAWEDRQAMSKPVLSNIDVTQQRLATVMDPRVYSFMRNMEIGLKWRDEETKADPDKRIEDALESHKQRLEMLDRGSSINTSMKTTVSMPPGTT